MYRDGLCGESANGFGLVRLVGQKIIVGISTSFYIVFSPLVISPHNKYHPNRIKTGKLIFTLGRFRLVGLVGRKMFVGILNSFYVVFGPLLAPTPNFVQIR